MHEYVQYFDDPHHNEVFQ